MIEERNDIAKLHVWPVAHWIGGMLRKPATPKINRNDTPSLRQQGRYSLEIAAVPGEAGKAQHWRKR
jgi:SRSO17 transposase